MLRKTLSNIVREIPKTTHLFRSTNLRLTRSMRWFIPTRLNRVPTLRKQKLSLLNKIGSGIPLLTFATINKNELDDKKSSTINRLTHSPHIKLLQLCRLLKISVSENHLKLLQNECEDLKVDEITNIFYLFAKHKLGNQPIFDGLMGLLKNNKDIKGLFKSIEYLVEFSLLNERNAISLMTMVNNYTAFSKILDICTYADINQDDFNFFVQRATDLFEIEKILRIFYKYDKCRPSLDWYEEQHFTRILLNSLKEYWKEEEKSYLYNLLIRFNDPSNFLKTVRKKEGFLFFSKVSYETHFNIEFIQLLIKNSVYAKYIFELLDNCEKDWRVSDYQVIRHAHFASDINKIILLSDKSEAADVFAFLIDHAQDIPVLANIIQEKQREGIIQVITVDFLKILRITLDNEVTPTQKPSFKLT